MIKTEDLEIGKVYECIISKRKCLFVSSRVIQGGFTGDFMENKALFYNKKTGENELEKVYDYQLKSE